MAFEQVGLEAVVKGANQYVSDMSKMESSTKGFTSILSGLTHPASIATSAVGSVTKALGTIGLASMGIQAITGAVGGLVKGMMSGNIAFEQYETTFAVLLKGTGSFEDGLVKAKERIGELSKFAAETPFELPEIVQADKLLQTFGGDALAVGDNLTMVGDMASASGAGFGEVAMWVGRAYSAIQSGRPFGEAGMRLQELGLLSGEARNQMEELQKAGASTEDQWANFTQTMGKFDGMMIQQSKTMGGLMSTLSDNIGFLKREAMAGLFQAIKPLFTGLVNFIGSPKLQEGAKKLGQLLGTGATSVFTMMGKAINAVMPYVRMFGNFIGNTLVPLADDLWYIFTYAFGKVKDAIYGVIFGFKEMDVTSDGIFGIGEKIGKVFGEAFEGIKGFIKDVIDGFQQLEDEAPVTWAEEFGRIIRQVGEAIQVIGKAIMDSMPYILDLMRTVGSDIWEDFTEVFSKIIGLFNLDAFADASNKTGTLAQNIGSAIRVFTSNPEKMEKVKDIIVKLVEAWLLLQGAKKVVSLTQNIVRTGAAFIDNIKNVAQTITQTVKMVGQYISTVANVAQTITQTVVHAGEKLFEITEKVVTQTINQVVNIIKPPEQDIENTGKSIGTKLGEGMAFAAGAALGKALLSIGPMLATAIEGISMAVVGSVLAAAIIAALILAFPEQVGNLAGAFAGFLIQANIESVKLSLQALKTIYYEIPKTIIQTITDPALWSNMGKAIAAIFTLHFGEAAKLGLDVLDKLTFGIPEIVLGAFKKIPWGTITSAMGTGLGVVWDFAKNWVSEFAKGFAEEFNKASPITIPEMKKFGESIIEGIYTGLVFAAEKVYTWAGSFLSWVKNFFGTVEDAASLLYDLGYNVIKGFVDGLTAGAKWAWNLIPGPIKSLGGAVLGAIGGLAGALEIRSPSELTAEIGRSIIEGLLVGMKEELPETVLGIAESFAKLSDSVLKSIETISGIAAGLTVYSGFDIRPLRNFLYDLKKVGFEITEALASFDAATAGAMEYAAGVADNIGKILGVISGSIDNLVALKDYAAISRASFMAFYRDMLFAAKMLGEAFVAFDAPAMEYAAGIAESTQKIMGAIGSAVSAFKELPTMAKINVGQLDTFIDVMLEGASHFADDVKLWDEEMMAHAGTIAESAGNIAGAIGIAIGAFANIVPLSARAEVIVGQIVDLLVMAVAKFAEGVGKIKDIEAESVSKLAGSAGNIVSAMGSLYTAFSKVIYFGQNSYIAAQKLAGLLVEVVRAFAAGVYRFKLEQSEATLNMSSAVKNLVDSFMAMQGGITSVSIKPLDNWVVALLNAFKHWVDLAKSITSDDTAKLQELANDIKTFLGTLGVTLGGGAAVPTGAGGGGGGGGTPAATGEGPVGTPGGGSQYGVSSNYEGTTAVTSKIGTPSPTESAIGAKSYTNIYDSEGSIVGKQYWDANGNPVGENVISGTINPKTGKIVGYQHGAWNLLKNTLAFLHKGEMVIPRPIAEMVRRIADRDQMVTTPGFVNSPPMTQYMGQTSNHNIGAVNVNVTINGNADAAVTKRATRDGVAQALRASGMVV